MSEQTATKTEPIFTHLTLPNGETIDLRDAKDGVMEALNKALFPKPITIENLKAAGFEFRDETVLSFVFRESTLLVYDSGNGNFEFLLDQPGCFDGLPLYPESMADIEALKRMLTPK